MSPHSHSGPASYFSAPQFNKDVWTNWASTRPLPCEDISVCSDHLEGTEQGWPPELMNRITSHYLHNIGITKASALIQAAVELDQTSFSHKFGPCFFERTAAAQETLRLFLFGDQSSINQPDYQSRLQFQMQHQFEQLGFQPHPFSTVMQVPLPDSPVSITLKTWNPIEKQLFDACYKGNFPLADQLLRDHVIEVNSKDLNHYNQSFLYSACRGPNCQPNIVELLLRNCASTKVPSGQGLSLPVHALVINFVNCTDPTHASHIPNERFDEYFGRLSAIIHLLKLFHADFNSINAYGHSPLSELEHENSAGYQPARLHLKFKHFCALVGDSSAKKLVVEAVVPAQPPHDADLAAAYEFLRKNPRLPDHTCLTISALIWSEKSSDWTHVLGRTPSLEKTQGCGLLGFMDDAILFKGSTLELKLREKHQCPIYLVLCNWPQDCTSNFEEPRVQWQWLLPLSGDSKPDDAAHKFITRGTISHIADASASNSSAWVPIEDESVLQQLKQKSTIIHHGHHKYSLSKSWFLERHESDTFGTGPLCGYRIRWVPDCEAAGEEDDEEVTGGCDDVVKFAVDQMQHQQSMLPISAHSAIFDSMAIPVQIQATAPIEVGKVVQRKYAPPPAIPSRPNQPLSPPSTTSALPTGWTQFTDPHGRICYHNQHTNSTSWDLPVDARRDQWFADNCFEPIPEQVFSRSIPPAKIPLRAHTSFAQDHTGHLQNTGLLVTFYSSNESVARIEGNFLRIIGPGQATIHAHQVGSPAFKPTSDWGVGASTQTINVVELVEFDVAVPETRLQAGYPILYSSIPTLLNLGPQNLKWSKDLKFVTIIATPDKGAILSGVWASVIGAHREIEQFQAKGVASLQKARKALFDLISKESPWVPKDSPTTVHSVREPNVILQDIKAYLQLLKQECDRVIEGFQKEVEAVIDDNVVSWMQIILTDSWKTGFMQHLTEHIVERLRSQTRPTASFKENMCVDVLKSFFDMKVKEFQSSLKEKGQVEEAKFESCKPMFERFRHAILQRVSKPGQRFLLSTMIQDFMIHLVSAGRGLTFYKDSALELIDSVLKNDVTSVTTATGSGKSTLMPLLLLAANIGIKRVAVTQPRRFAAFSIYETIAKYHGKSVVGYAMAGESVNPMAPIVYITDGLLRTQMNLDREYSGFDCIIIDEVHERSENIDACVALLAKMKHLKLKMPKVILSSATLDDKVINPFMDAGCSIGKCATMVMSPFARLLHYPDRHCGKPSCSICQQLAVKTFPLSMIKFVNKNQHLYMKAGPTGAGQMLVFMPSTQEVISTVEELKESNIIAYPLYAGQDGKTQSDSLRNGTIFISTNIAETSLTFPNLRVVIDLGKVQRPRLIDSRGKLLPAPLMETVEASRATLSQRIGRVGRTCDGHYIALFQWGSQSGRLEHIQAGLELFPSDSVCFSLSKQLRCSQPTDLSFPGKGIRIVPLDHAYITFPELGCKQMADAFYASLKLGCSEDILLLAAFMMKIPPKSQNLVVNSGQKLLPPAAAGQVRPRGDISVVLEIMRMINSVVPPGTPQKPASRKMVSDAIASWCSKHGLDIHCRPLFKTYLEFQKMQAFYLPQRPPPNVDHSKSHPLFSRINPPIKSFDALGKQWNGFAFGRKLADGRPDMTSPENYESRRLVRGSSIEKVIEALSFGYPDNFFVHCAELDGPVNSYSRVADRGDGGDEEGQIMKTYYTLHSKSALAKADKDKFTVMFAISSMMFGAEMHDVLEPFRLGALGIAEPCSIDVLPDSAKSTSLTRRIALHVEDVVPAGFDHREVTADGKRYAELRGTARSVISRELAIRKHPQLRIDKEKIKLVEATVKQKTVQEQHTQKLTQLQEAKDKNVFKPLSFMWKNLYNAKLEIHVSNIQDLHINFSGRRQQLHVLKKHMDFWAYQLGKCPQLKFEADDVFSGIEHFRMPDPKNFGGAKNPEYAAFRKRLHNVTAEDLNDEDIFEMTMGKDATRESRMEAVTRIALQMFECRVVGGFVRDWIVNGERKHPPKSLHPRDWVHILPDYEVQQPPSKPAGWMKWDFKDDVQVIPKDLDIELMTQYFDVNRFIFEVTKYGIVVDHHQHIPQRHIFLFDKETGPFTADFIEPHFACLHTLGDFNVNCLCVSRFPDQIGLKMEYTSPSGAEHTLDVNKVISDCRQHQLVPMQQLAGILNERTEKMRSRGWFISGCF